MTDTAQRHATGLGAGEGTVGTDDGADLAVTVLEPLASGPAAGTVLLSHGWGAARRVWGTVADRLIRAGHRVVLYDQRGHGASGQGREPVSVDRLGRDVAAVLDADATERTVVVGHSGGGFAAMAYAAGGSPAIGRVSGLVLLGTAAHGQETPDSEVRMMASPLFSRALAQPALGRRLLAGTMGKRPDPRLLEVNRQMFAATPAPMRAACFRCSRGMDLRTDLAAADVPAVVLAGAQDRTIPPRLGRAAAEALPDARFEELAGVGHMVPLEAPDAVAVAVAEVVEAVPDTTSGR